VLSDRASSMLALVGVVFLLALLSWIDSARGGSSTMLSRCNLALSRADRPAADVLLIGSSRSGVAFDPVAIQGVLRRETQSVLTVDRIAIGNMTLRVSEALFETYLRRRGAPKIVVLETAFMTPRTVRHLAPVANGKPSEHFLFSRDLNLMTFAQLMRQPAVAMPYTEPETLLALWQVRLRGTISRAGALIYQFAKTPFDSWSVDDCDRADFAREPTWPDDFSFAYGDYGVEGELSDSIAELREEISQGSAERELEDWQISQPQGRFYPYDFDAAYRQGELSYFLEIVHKSRAAGARVLIMPLPLYGYEIAPADVASLKGVLPEGVQVVDIYNEIGADFSTFWYDDAHIEKSPTGVLTSALLSDRLLGLLIETPKRD
jgi:hypothetical protein